MSDESDNDKDLFDLAARVAGVDVADLLKVRRSADGDGLVVVLMTGQKLTFNSAALAAAAGQLAGQLAAQVTAAAEAVTPKKSKKA